MFWTYKTKDCARHTKREWEGCPFDEPRLENCQTLVIKRRIFKLTRYTLMLKEGCPSVDGSTWGLLREKCQKLSNAGCSWCLKANTIRLGSHYLGTCLVLQDITPSMTIWREGNALLWWGYSVPVPRNFSKAIKWWPLVRFWCAIASSTAINLRTCLSPKDFSNFSDIIYFWRYRLRDPIRAFGG